MRGFMQRFHTIATVGLPLFLCVVFLAGCSWTNRQLGLSDSASEPAAQNAAAAQRTVPPDANAADKRALLRLDFGISEPLRIKKRKGPVQTQATYQTSTIKAANRPESRSGSRVKMVVKQRQAPAHSTRSEPANAKQAKQTRETKPAASAKQPAAAPDSKTTAQKKPELDPNGPQPPKKLHTSVPFKPLKKTPPPSPPPPAPAPKQQKGHGDIRYMTTKALREAVDKAAEQDSFLGYTDPFDAFPIIEGNDTMSAAFIPVNHPNHKVFYHAFYAPDKPYHRRVYGYTVINMLTSKDYGHFDGDADGKFEQNTLHPKVFLDDYVRTSKSNFGEKMPEVERKKQ